MPIEIRELVIKTTFEDQHRESNPSGEQLADLKDQIINECVDQIMEILKDKMER
jgi:hypothetical protein